MGDYFAAKQKGARNNGKWTLPVKPIINQHNKHARIARLEPAILNGSIIFNSRLAPEFFQQADEFGAPRVHDDALDALASCIEMIQNLDGNTAKNIRHIPASPLTHGKLRS